MLVEIGEIVLSYLRKILCYMYPLPSMESGPKRQSFYGRKLYLGSGNQIFMEITLSFTKLFGVKVIRLMYRLDLKYINYIDTSYKYICKGLPLQLI